MKLRWGLAAVLLAASEALKADPLGKTLDLLKGLQAKVQKDGEQEEAAFKEYSSWCREVLQNTGFEIKTATSARDGSDAKISELAAKIIVATSKIEDLANANSVATSQLADAQAVRDRESAEFLAGEKELTSVIDTLIRVIGVLEREMSKNPASFAQLDTSSMAAVLATLGALVEAAAFPVADQQKLMALLQSQSEHAADAEDQELGAPEASAYKSQSSSIVDLLDDMKDKAEEQLRNLRNAESSARHNFELLKQSLQDQTAASSKDLAQEKASKSAAEEGKATAEGELEVATRELKAGHEKLEATTSGCNQVAADHDDTVKSRKEELQVIEEVMQILASSTGAAMEQSYSLVQLSSSSHRGLLVRGQVLRIVRKLAKQHHSAALAELASKVSAIIRYASRTGADPFAKVRQLIQDLLTKLEEAASADETEKAFCDAELSKTAVQREELETSANQLDAKLGQAVAKSSELKQQVAELQSELAAITKEQAELDKIRQESRSKYQQAKADLEAGLAGVRQALGVLRQYYGNKASLVQDNASFDAMMNQPEAPKRHDKDSGGASSIIGLLEVVESDFAKNLAIEDAAEGDAQSNYDKVTQDNKLATTAKDGDVKYKSQEAASLDKSITELTSDHNSLGAQLAAVLEYDGKVKERCVAKPEAYKERAARRSAEINGLKEAIKVLSEEVALPQRSHRGHMRGATLRP